MTNEEKYAYEQGYKAALDEMRKYYICPNPWIHSPWLQIWAALKYWWFKR
jgi:hypothetical protein